MTTKIATPKKSRDVVMRVDRVFCQTAKCLAASRATPNKQTTWLQLWSTTVGSPVHRHLIGLAFHSWDEDTSRRTGIWTLSEPWKLRFSHEIHGVCVLKFTLENKSHCCTNETATAFYLRFHSILNGLKLVQWPTSWALWRYLNICNSLIRSWPRSASRSWSWPRPRSTSWPRPRSTSTLQLCDEAVPHLQCSVWPPFS